MIIVTVTPQYARVIHAGRGDRGSTLLTAPEPLPSMPANAEARVHAIEEMVDRFEADMILVSNDLDVTAQGLTAGATCPVAIFHSEECY